MVFSKLGRGSVVVTVCVAGLAVAGLGLRARSGVGSAPVVVAKSAPTGAATAGSPLVPISARAKPPGMWRAGDELTYDVDFGTRVEKAEANSNWASLVGSGKLNVVAGVSNADAIELRCTLTELSVYSDGDQTETREVEDTFQGDFHSPFFLTLDLSGRIRSLSVASKGQGLGILRMVAASLQFVQPDAPPPVGEPWFTSEADHQGRFRARYERTDGGYRKVKVEYSELVVAQQFSLEKQGLKAAVEAQTSYAFDAAGHLARVEATETIGVPLKPIGFRTRSHVTLRLVHAGTASTASSRPEGLVEAPLFGAVTTGGMSAAQRERRRASVAGASFEQVLGEIRAGKTKNERWDAMERMAALFDEDPSSIGAAKRALLDAKGQESELLLGSLGSATSDAAEVALVEIGKDEEYDARIREVALNHLSLQTEPSATAIAGLSELLRDTDDASVKEAARLALGSTAGRSDSPEARRAVSALSTEFDAAKPGDDRAGVVTALGNAGSEDALPTIQRALSDPDPEVRAAAVMALRKFPAGEADKLIAGFLLNDESPMVRQAAVTAARTRAPSPQIDAAAARVLLADPADAIRLSVISLASLGVSRLPALAAALRSVSANDRSEAVRQAAAQALAESS